MATQSKPKLLSREEITWYNSASTEIRLSEKEEEIILYLRFLNRRVDLNNIAVTTITSILNPNLEDTEFFEFLKFIVDNKADFEKIENIEKERYSIDATIFKLNENMANNKLLESLFYLFMLFRKQNS